MRIIGSAVRGAAVLAVAVLASTLALSSAAAQTPHAAPAAVRSATQNGTTVSVAAGNGTLAPGADLSASVVITNSGSTVIDPGTVTIALTTSDLDTRDALDSWVAGSGDRPATRDIGSTETSLIAPGSSVTVVVGVAAASIGITAPNVAVYGLSATLASGGATVSEGFNSIVWNPGTGSTQTPLTIAMPITAPANTDGLISSADLATYTGLDGILSRQLDAAYDRSDIAIGIDPMIIASIRVLGSSAPASATEWLQQLATATNTVFPLQYGDADVAGEIQSGITQLMGPTSFVYAMDPANFRSAQPTTGETVQPTESPTPLSTATPSPTPTPAPTVPSLQQILSWTYTTTGIAWPGDDTVKASDVASLVSNKLTTTILSSDNTNASSLKTTPSAALPITGGTALVADAAISSALRDAVNATSENSWNEAMSRLNSQLALVSAEKTSDQRVLLATLDRGWPSSWERASQTFTSLSSMPWAKPATLRDAISAPATDGLAIKDAPESQDRTTTIGSLATRETELGSFATVLQQPALLTGPTRNSLLATLGVGWQDPQNDWPTAVAADLKKSAKTLNSVQIAPPDNVNLVNNQGLIPITVTNDFTLPATIVLEATPSNGRLEIDSDTTKSVPAGASAKVLVPVKAKLGNGKVQLSLQLTSPTGVLIGTTKKVPVDVHADWEGIGAVILGAIAVLFFGFGLVRSILRRRRERDDDDSDLNSADADVTGDADPAPAAAVSGSPPGEGSGDVQ